MITEDIPPRHDHATYHLTQKPELSLIDSVLYLLRGSETLNWLPSSIDDHEITDSFRPLYKTIWDKNSVACLSDVKLPDWLDGKGEPSQVLRDTLDMLEHNFVISPFRNHEEPSQDISAVLETVFTSNVVKDCHLMTAIDRLGMDLLIKSFHTMTPEQKVEAVKQNRSKIEDSFKNGAGITSLRSYLLKESGRKFLQHSEADYSAAFEELMRCFEADFVKKLKNRPWKKLEFGYRKLENLVVAGNNFERFDLVNQAALGVFDLSVNYKSISKQVSVLLCLRSIAGHRIYCQQKIQLVNDFAIQNIQSTKSSFQTAISLTSVDEIMEGIIKVESLILQNMVKSDFDFIGVFFDESREVYRYITQKESVNRDVMTDNSNSLIIFNSQDKDLQEASSIRVLFAHNPDSMAQAHTRKYELFWFKKDEAKTLYHLAQYLSTCKFGNSAAAHEILACLAFSTDKMTFNTQASKGRLLVDTKSHNFEEDTPITTVISALGRGNGDLKVIDLFCFEVKESSNYSFDYLHTGSEIVINLKPKLQNLVNYLFGLEAEISGKLSGNKFKDRDLSFYLPNVIFLNVSKVSCCFQLSSDMNLDCFKKMQAEKEHLDTRYVPIGGITSASISGSTCYRPFVVTKEDGRYVAKLVEVGGTLSNTDLLQNRPEDIVIMAFEKQASHISD